VIGSVLLLSALALAPVIGGGFGELTNGILQILVLGAIGCRLLLNRGESGAWARVPGLWFLAAFVALCLISTVFTRAIYFSLSQMLFFLTCLGAYMLSATLCRDKRVAAAVVWVLLLSALTVSVLGIRNYAIDAGGGASFWKSVLGSGEHSRLFGPFINPGYFAGYLVIALPVTLGAYLVTRRVLLVVLAGLGFVAEILALMLTGAKFGIVAAVAALGIFFLLAIATKSLRRSRFIRLLAICVLVTPLLVLFSAPVRSRIQAAESGGSEVHSTVFRVYTWQATWNMIKAQPWLGTGPGTYPITYQQYAIAGPTRLAHNSYLQIAAECGVPALIAFFVLLLAIARGSLLGIARGTTRPSDHPREATDEPATGGITWMDMVPFSAWRLMNCALFSALAGSAIRSLVDSDWYVIGLSLPFWIVAGVLVSQSGAAEKSILVGKRLRPALAALCGITIVMSTSFGLGDYYGSQAEAVIADAPDESSQIMDLYRRASIVSPLTPKYHRQLAMWLGLQVGDFTAAEKEVEKAISLAHNTSETGWYSRGMLAGAQKDLPTAISSFRTALKFNPHSTQTLYRLAQVYRFSGDTRSLESEMRRLIVVEDSPYEKIKGTPEIVDGTYAFAHSYFGAKYLRQQQYGPAIREYLAAIDRLERWRSSGDMRKVQQMMGLVNKADEQNLLDLLRECYQGLATAYTGIGNKAEAAGALSKAMKVK
jgi:putative inorganic carbon (HCO3(-)) transporter